MKKLYTENGITTATVVEEATKKFPELNIIYALDSYRRLQIAIFDSACKGKPKKKKITADKIALSTLLLQPYLEFFVRGN